MLRQHFWEENLRSSGGGKRPPEHSLWTVVKSSEELKEEVRWVRASDSGLTG